MKKPTVEEIALAFAKADKLAGLSCTPFDKAETEEQRAANMIRCGYIVAGDPGGWADGGEAIASIFCEQRGGDDDCIPPADYYAEFGRQWAEIGEHLPGFYWEWVNAAVGLVWPV